MNLDFLILYWGAPLFLLILAIWTGWNIWTADFVEGEIAGYRIKETNQSLPRFLRDKQPFTVIHCKIQGHPSEVEIPKRELLKPEGHRVKLWVKKRKHKIKPYLAGEAAARLLALSAFLSLIFSASAFVTIILILAIFIVPALIDSIFLNALPPYFFKKPEKKLATKEYNDLTSKEGSLSYEEVVAIHYRDSLFYVFMMTALILIACALAYLGLID